MGYDIDLCDPVTGKIIELPVKHMMHGNMYPAEYDKETGTFTPLPTSEATLGVTYNYADYYYEATEGDKRFVGVNAWDEPDAEPYNLGMRGIYGKTGAESIPMLKDMIQRITEKYSDDGEWITTERKKTIYIDKNGNEVELVGAINKGIEYVEKDVTVKVNEGVNSDYWESTAGNAIRPLFQLIAMAQLRPDGIWKGD